MATTGKFIGAQGNEGFAFYDPATGQIVKVPIADKPRGLLPYTNVFGQQVWGLPPASGTHSRSINGESQMFEGADPTLGQIIDRPTNTTPVPDPVRDPNWVAPKPVYPPGYDENGKPIPVTPPPVAYTRPGGPSPPVTPTSPGSMFANSGLGSKGMGVSNDWAPAGATGRDTGYQFDPDYSLTYAPGEHSRWGDPNKPGNSRDFYSQQFNNLLKEQQGWRQQSIAAAVRKQDADKADANAPDKGWAPDWSWANLPNTRTFDWATDSAPGYAENRQMPNPRSGQGWLGGTRQPDYRAAPLTPAQQAAIDAAYAAQNPTPGSATQPETDPITGAIVDYVHNDAIYGGWR